MNQLENMTFDEIQIGAEATMEKTVSEEAILLFAAATGDVNPVHVDAEYAAQTSFKEPIAHGMWTGSLISTLLATELPGPGCVYLSQSLQFLRPVKAGDTLTVSITVKEKNQKKQSLILECLIKNQRNKRIVTGSAVVLAPTEKITIKTPRLPEIRIG